jgi:hypothetical protein
MAANLSIYLNLRYEFSGEVKKVAVGSPAL